MRLIDQELLAVATTPAPIATQFGMQVPYVSGTVIEIQFQGISGRDPSTAGDFVALWEAQSYVPWGQSPQNKQAITSKLPSGDQPFSGLSLASLPYVVAYSVGPAADGTNIAAAIPLGAGGTAGALQTTGVQVAYVGATSLIVSYATPGGSTPLTFGHTIQLVNGQVYLPTTKVIATTQPSDNASDSAQFSDVTMVMGQWYTVAYLCGSKASTVAATVTFQVAPPSEIEPSSTLQVELD